MTAAFINADKASTSMLDELNSGFLDGYTYGDVKVLYPEEYALRKKDKLRYRYPGGEFSVFGRIGRTVLPIPRNTCGIFNLLGVTFNLLGC